MVKFEQGFDVGEHLRDQLLREHPVSPVLLIDPELENLKYSNELALFLGGKIIYFILPDQGGEVRQHKFVRY